MMMMMMRWLYVAESIGVRLPQDVCFPSSHISTIHAISLSDLMFMMTVMVMMMVMVIVMILIKEYSCSNYQYSIIHSIVLMMTNNADYSYWQMIRFVIFLMVIMLIMEEVIIYKR